MRWWLTWMGRTSIERSRRLNSGTGLQSSIRSMRFGGGTGGRRSSGGRSWRSTCRIDRRLRYLTRRSRTQTRRARMRSPWSSIWMRSRRRMARMGIVRRPGIRRIGGGRRRRRGTSWWRCGSTFRGRCRRRRRGMGRRRLGVMLMMMRWRSRMPRRRFMKR